MELWCTMEKIWSYGKSYGIMEKNYGTIPRIMKLRFTKKKKIVDYQKLRIFIYNEKTWGNIPEELNFLIKYIALEHWFIMEKLLYYEKKYGTMEKLCHYWKNYGTILKLSYYSIYFLLG